MNIVFYLHDELDPFVFEKKIQWFKRHYTLVSSKDIYDYYYQGKALKNACHLTVDDGWLSTYQIIFPILLKYQIPISIFVSPHMCSLGKNFWYMEAKGYDEGKIKDILISRAIFTSEIKKYPIDLIFKEMKISDVYDVLEEYRKIHQVELKPRNVVNIDELFEMQRSGLVEIGAHTKMHPILMLESENVVRNEIKDSIEELSDILHRQIISFAYPNGIPNIDFGKREIEYVKKYGIKLAYSVQPGSFTSSKDPLIIPRTCSIPRLKLGGIGLHLPSLHDQMKPRNEIRKYKL